MGTFSRYFLGLLALLCLMSPSGRAAELIMVEQAGCIWCARFDQQVAPIYPKTAEGQLAPLRRLDIRSKDLQDLGLKTTVRYTPTFILIEGNSEIGRITGFQGDETFWGLLGTLVKRIAPPAKRQADPT